MDKTFGEIKEGDLIYCLYAYDRKIAFDVMTVNSIEASYKLGVALDTIVKESTGGSDEGEHDYWRIYNSNNRPIYWANCCCVVYTDESLTYELKNEVFAKNLKRNNLYRRGNFLKKLKR